eukprot:gene10883-biopygen1795
MTYKQRYCASTTTVKSQGQRWNKWPAPESALLMHLAGETSAGLRPGAMVIPPGDRHTQLWYSFWAPRNSEGDPHQGYCEDCGGSHRQNREQVEAHRGWKLGGNRENTAPQAPHRREKRDQMKE